MEQNLWKFPKFPGNPGRTEHAETVVTKLSFLLAHTREPGSEVITTV